MRRTFLAFVVIVSALAAPALAADMAAQVQKACAGCHSLGMLCDKMGGNPDYWRETVARMVASGAQVESGQSGPMADYLAGLDKAKSPFCK